MVLRWNETACTAIRVDRTPPPVAARNLAIMSAALLNAPLDQRILAALALAVAILSGMGSIDAILRTDWNYNP